MFNDWKTDRSKEELAILSSYMDKGSFFSTVYLVNAYGTTALFIQLPWWPRIADLVMPLNTSRPRTYIIPAYYPLDEDRYYYLIIFQMTMEVIVLMFVYVACDTCFIYSVQHACGLFATCGYRFKEAVRDVSASSDILSLPEETYEKVCRSAEAHSRAITFVKEFEEIHFGYLLICLATITVAFSGTLALLSKLNICPQFYECVVFLIVQLVHLFLLTVQGQFVSNSNWKTYNEIYEGLWYLAVPKTQMVYMQALRATLSAPQITAGRRIPMNLETFASIIKASVSYFTMLKSA
ncbi:odorant receptor 13a-like [Megachile rotundata]|uniref:odorant receptor 13a-like n=1 Tax=Megachile rotundata TaxID=143995 RepID=UPI003FD0521F